MITGTEDYILAVTDLRKTYGKLVAVDNLSFPVKPGADSNLLYPWDGTFQAPLPAIRVKLRLP